MVKAILGGGRSVQAAWQDAPSANGHRSAFFSTRSPGYVAQMDTESASAGFTRSIVMKSGLAPADVRAGAAGSASAAALGLPLEPTLTGTGITLGSPDIAKLPAAGSTGHVDVPFTIKDRKKLPTGIEASVRWDPIDVATVVAPDPANEVGGATTDTGAATAPDGPAAAATGFSRAFERPGCPSRKTGYAFRLEPDQPARRRPHRRTIGEPAAVPSDDAGVQHDLTKAGSAPVAATPPDDVHVAAPDNTFDLVVPEQTGDVVAPATVGIGKKALSVPVTFPSGPGSLPTDRHPLRQGWCRLRRGDAGHDPVADRPRDRRLRWRDPGRADGRPGRGRERDARGSRRQPRQVRLGPSRDERAVRPPGRVLRPTSPPMSSVAGSRSRSRRLSRPTRRPRSSARPCRSA